MNTLITKTPFYVRPLGADGEAKQEFVRLGSGAVLRQRGQRWCSPMSYHRAGAKHLCYRVHIVKGVDDLGQDLSGQNAFASVDRFTAALVSAEMTPEQTVHLAR